MRKTLLLFLAAFMLSVQTTYAQNENDTIRESIGALVAAHMLGSYSAVTMSVNSYVKNTGSNRDSAHMHIAFSTGTVKTSMEYLKKLENLDFFSDDDKRFIKEAVAVLEKIQGLADMYLSIIDGDKTTDTDKYYKARAKVRAAIFQLLDMDESLTY